MLARRLGKGKLLRDGYLLCFHASLDHHLPAARSGPAALQRTPGSPARRKACWSTNAPTRALQGGALYAGFPNLCWILRAFSLLCASLALLGLQPAYALRIQLRARTDLRLQATQEAAGLRLRGQLSDSRGAPVGGAAVVFAVVTGQGPTVDLQAMTNESGLFDALVARDRLPEAADLVHVEARFGGDPRLGESTAATTLDVQKLEAAIELHLETDRVAADAAPLEALLDVRSGELPIPGAPVQILIDGRALVLVRTAGDGHARASIPIEQLGQPGRHVVQAAVLPSEQFNEASAAARVEVHMGLAVELHVRPGSAGQTCALGDWCRLAGRLHRHRCHCPQWHAGQPRHLCAPAR